MANGDRAERGEQKNSRATRPAGQERDLAPARPPAARQPQPAAGRRNATFARPHDETASHVAPGYLGEFPPPGAAPTWKRRLYVERPADLGTLAQDLQAAHVIALDAEFAQVRGRVAPGEPAHRLALLQLACDNDYRASYVVDAQRLADLSPLRAALDDGRILKLFHGIGADARVLAARGLVARHTLDLEAVSRSIFGQRESGLQSMLQHAGGVRLDKSLQRADWSRRPLTPAMVAYAARDAEMTLVLYGWLRTHYAWAVDLHEVPADEPPPPVADWIAPYLEGARPRPALVAVAEAGIMHDLARQVSDLREALAAVRHPTQRARVMRLITDLELAALAPDLRAYLAALASEERAGAARALGRLHDTGAIELVRPLLNDPVQDVRQAAQLALESLSARAGRRPSGALAPAPAARPPRSSGPLRWTSATEGDEAPAPEGGWQARLRARFAADADGAGKASEG